MVFKGVLAFSLSVKHLLLLEKFTDQCASIFFCKEAEVKVYHVDDQEFYMWISVLSHI
jgi:hypothetical protein